MRSADSALCVQCAHTAGRCAVLRALWQSALLFCWDSPSWSVRSSWRAFVATHRAGCLPKKHGYGVQTAAERRARVFARGDTSAHPRPRRLASAAAATVHACHRRADDA